MNRKCQVSKTASGHGVQQMETRYSYFEVLGLESGLELSVEDFRTFFCKENMLFTSLLYSLL